MAKKFYVLNTEAQVQAGAEKYRLVQGKELEEIITTPEWKRKEFIFQKQQNGEQIGIEVPESKRKESRAEKNRKVYLRKVMAERDISITSLDVIIGSEEKGSGEDVIADESANIEEIIFAREDMETLKQAINGLSEEEYHIIFSLYLAESRKTERDLAKEMNITQATVNRRKGAILRKMKNFFEV